MDEIWGVADGPRTLAAAAALQLDPQNLHASLRLERLAAFAARLPSYDQRLLSTSTLRRLIDSDDVSGPHILASEDEFVGIWVKEIAFWGGPYLTLQGQTTNCGQIAQVFLEAIFKAPKELFPTGFRIRARVLADLLLKISDTMCRSAGLHRNQTPDPGSGRLAIPSARTLDERASMVRFRLDDLLEPFPPPARDFLTDVLVRSSDELPEWTHGEMLDDAIIVTPLIRDGDEVIVASPAELMATLRHHLVLQAFEWGCETELVESLVEVAVQRIDESLSGSIDGEFERVNDIDLPNVAHLRAGYDLDKVLDVYVVADDLSDYNPDAVYGMWFAAEVFETIEAQYSTLADSENTLRIVGYQQVGRDSFYGVPREDVPGPRLFVDLDDLDDILRTPTTDRMTLWYFARAHSALSADTDVMSFSTFDMFALYVDQRESFYLDDGPRPTFLQVASGRGQELRLANHGRLDQRTVVHPVSGISRNAIRMHGLSSPVYLVMSHPATFYVDDIVQAWISLKPGKDSVVNRALFTLGEAAAYWVWQLAVAGFPFPDEQALTVVLESRSDDPLLHWVIGTIDQGRHIVAVHRPAEPSRENEIDRELVAALIESMGTGENPGKWTDQVAPVGDKRMVHILDPNSDPVRWPGQLPDVLHARDAAIAELLDELGSHMDQGLHIPVGDIEAKQRGSVLNDLVSWLIDKLGDVFRKFDAAATLEVLLTQYEALTAENYREASHLPARLACFGATDDEVAKISRHRSKATTTALALRFLIELRSGLMAGDTATASGAPSRGAVDQMVAIASEIINKGMLSDALRFSISNVEMSRLPSGRFGTNHDEDPYYLALVAFSRARSARQMEGPDGEVPDRMSMESADALASLEFGYSFSEFTAACGQILSEANELGQEDILALRADHVRARLIRELGWDESKASKVLRDMTLTPIAGDMAGYWADWKAVAPWRFGRTRSLLRQPLLHVSDEDGGQLVTGRRTLFLAPAQLHGQFASGRLKATHPDMLSALGKMRKAKGDAFEVRVEQTTKAAGFTHTRRRLRRIGEFDLRDIEGQNLGDIDVAAVDETAKLLLLIEAKSLEVARTPAELANEIAELFDDKSSAQLRLSTRSQWVKDHLAETLQELGAAGSPTSWRVVELIVVSEHLVSQELDRDHFDLVAIQDLARKLQELSARPSRRS